MKTSRISPRSIELLVGILATALMVTGIALYTLNEPARLQEAQVR